MSTQENRNDDDAKPDGLAPPGHALGQRARRSQPFGNPALTALTDDELLDLPFCDLNLRIEGTPLEQRIAELEEELKAKRISFRPHFWLSEEWFTPDGVPGVAIPFYLADSRLMRLERRQMFDVEGGTADWCMRIKRKGFHVWYAHRAILYHMVSAATGVYKAGRTFHEVEIR